MSIIRGKATDVVSFFSSPFAWIQSLMFLEKENQVLREKNLELSLKVESMLNLQNENNAFITVGCKSQNENSDFITVGWKSTIWIWCPSQVI